MPVTKAEKVAYNDFVKGYRAKLEELTKQIKEAEQKKEKDARYQRVYKS